MREGGGDDPNCKSQPAERARRQTPAAKPVSSLRIRKPRVSGNFPLVSPASGAFKFILLGPKIRYKQVFSNEGLTVYINTLIFILYTASVHVCIHVHVMCACIQYNVSTTTLIRTFKYG